RTTARRRGGADQTGAQLQRAGPGAAVAAALRRGGADARAGGADADGLGPASRPSGVPLRAGPYLLPPRSAGDAAVGSAARAGASRRASAQAGRARPRPARSAGPARRPTRRAVATGHRLAGSADEGTPVGAGIQAPPGVLLPRRAARPPDARPGVVGAG